MYNITHWSTQSTTLRGLPDITHSAGMIWSMQTLVYWMVKTTSSWRGGQKWPSGSASSPSFDENHHVWDSQYPGQKTNWSMFNEPETFVLGCILIVPSLEKFDCQLDVPNNLKAVYFFGMMPWRVIHQSRKLNIILKVD